MVSTLAPKVHKGFNVSLKPCQNCVPLNDQIQVLES